MTVSGVRGEDGRATREELISLIEAAFRAEDMPGVAAGIRALAVVAPDDAELILAWIDHTAGTR